MRLSNILSFASAKQKKNAVDAGRGALFVWGIPIVSFSLLIVTLYYVVYPWFVDTRSKQDAIKMEEQEITQLREKLEVLQSYDEDTLKQYLLRLSLSVPAQDSPPLVMATVEQALNAASMVLETVQYGGLTEIAETEEIASPTEDGSEVTITPVPTIDLRAGDVNLIVSARGDFASVNSFLKTIRTVNPLIVGVDVRVTDVTGTEDDNDFSKKLSFKGMAPFQSLPEDLGTLTSEVKDLTTADLELIEELSGYVTFFEVRDATNPDRFNVGKENPF